MLQSIIFGQLVSRTVVDRKVVVQGASQPEGMIVAMLARESDETFNCPAELEAHPQASITEAARGETLTSEDLVARLRRIP